MSRRRYVECDQGLRKAGNRAAPGTKHGTKEPLLTKG